MEDTKPLQIQDDHSDEPSLDESVGTDGDTADRRDATAASPIATNNKVHGDASNRADYNTENLEAHPLDDDLEDPEGQSERPGALTRFVRRIRINLFSSLTRRIVLLNLLALVVLLTGILYLNQFRAGLIDARVESLLTQGRIIAGAIAASASVETDAITIDPERLLELQAGESAAPSLDTLESLEYPINPELVAPVLRSLIQPTRTRARIYDREGLLILDSRHLYAGGQVLRYDLPPIQEERFGSSQWLANLLNRLLQRDDLPIYEEFNGPGTQYPEVTAALNGSPVPVERITKSGELIVSVAVPVQRFRAVLGVLLLSTQGGDIDRIVAEERLAIMRVFLVASIVTIVLSFFLASTIGNPLRRLSEAANRVRRGVRSRVEIPDFSGRHDEIGLLSTSLRDMTRSLYARIEAIESFAADVSHELKNPLTSLRSAVETLPLARNEQSRERLMEVIQHDVRRLDRLITDISDASRLDAELVREDAKPVDLARLISGIVSAAEQAQENKIAKQGKAAAGAVRFKLNISKSGYGTKGYMVSGHDVRLGQVFDNLISNAMGFVPKENGEIEIRMGRSAKSLVVVVQDNGPGIQAEKIDRIFERFYTDRPEAEGFGQNSGLGLSISRQIIEAHGGTIRAENRGPSNRSKQKVDADAITSGARFTITLPADELA